MHHLFLLGCVPRGDFFGNKLRGGRYKSILVCCICFRKVFGCFNPYRR